ncbi:MAG: acetylornithine/succinylornithine family transaminase [Lachnospiraceae bacterium]|nr:acetylornithine/succinylornithine family transaminase [Lachnospiraceae bacterium]
MRLKDTGMTHEEFTATVEKYMMNLAPRFDLIADTAKGMSVFDENGDEYLDFYGGIAVSSAGNCNPKVVDAICMQALELIHGSNYPYTVPQGMLAKLICETLSYEKIWFQNSGAEANEAMIKLARKYGTDHYGENRYKIVTALNSFHGRTMATLTATGQPGTGIQNGFGPLVPGFSYAEFNNLESFKDACDEDTIAIMLEPVQGEGGVFPATEEFMKGIRELCDEKKMLLLFDEVQTGWGRLGSTMGYERFGVKPDIVSMAKAMGGGMPIGAICTSEEIAKSFIGAHGSTYAGNPICAAASYAQIKEILDYHLPQNALAKGKYFMKKATELPHVKEVRGLGLLMGIELEPEVSAAEVKHECMERKMLITAMGHNTLRLVPPLIVSEAECDHALGILKDAISAVAKD